MENIVSAVKTDVFRLRINPEVWKELEAVCAKNGLIAYLIGNRFGKVRASDVSEAAEKGLTIDGKYIVGSEEYKQELQVEWIGYDGAMCLLYAGLAVFIGYGMINRADWIIGGFVPAICAVATTGIFLRYLFEVFTFGRWKAE